MSSRLEDVIEYVVPFLEVRELLRLEQVSLLFNETVKQDTSLWRKIIIKHPLSIHISDKALAQLISKSKGSLHTLKLHQCHLLTGDELIKSLENCPNLKKLAIPQCPRISHTHMMKLMFHFHLKYNSFPINQMRLTGTLLLHDIPIQDYTLLKHNLETSSNFQNMTGKDVDGLDFDSHMIEKHRPSSSSYYHEIMNMKATDVFEDSEMVIDLDICPKCSSVGRVYDCPPSRCQHIFNSDEDCIGCLNCIPRCRECGKCEANMPSSCGCGLCTQCYKTLSTCLYCHYASCSHHVEGFEICSPMYHLCHLCYVYSNYRH